MSKKTRLWATLSFGVGLILARSALAQGTAATASTPVGSSASIASSSQPTPTPTQPGLLVIKPVEPRADQPTYSVDRPPEGSSGIYLPAVVLGYTRSVVGCVVVGCDDGPQVHDTSVPDDGPQVHDTSGPTAKTVGSPGDAKSAVPR